MANPQNGIGSHHDHDHDHGHNRNGINTSGVYYGGPWWGTSYWNGQNYGNGNDNNGTYNDVTYTPDGSVTNPPGNNDQSSSGSAQPVVPPSVTPAGEAAQLANSVDKSPDLVEANNQVQLAQVAYDKERERALAALTTKPEYQQALSRKHDAVSDLHNARAAATTSPAVIEAATAKLDASDEVTKMQEQAVATDPQANQAKQQLAQAVAHRDEVRSKLMTQH
jgi:hypothetical protein